MGSDARPITIKLCIDALPEIRKKLLYNNGAAKIMADLVRCVAGLGMGVLLTVSGAALAAEPRPPVPIGNPSNWVQMDDYPARALRNNEKGKVAFALSFDSAGKPQSCEVTSSSGSMDLDEATCRTLMARAAFRPGMDAEGRPQGGVYRSSVNWGLSDDKDGDVPEPTLYKMAYTIGADGVVSHCEMAAGDEPWRPVPAGSGPGACNLGKALRPAKDANGKPVAKRVITTIRTEVETVP